MRFTSTTIPVIKRRVTVLNCHCHCGSSLLFEFDPVDGEICVSTLATPFYSKQHPIRNAIKDKLAAAWAMLRGKEYFLHEIILTDEKWDEFVTCVNEIDKERKESMN